MHQKLWGYKVEKKLYVGVREQKRLNTAGLDDARTSVELWLEFALPRHKAGAVPKTTVVM